MRIYFLRHGQSNYNLRQLCNDDPSQSVHLTDLGRRQAAAAGERLRDVPLEAVFVSPLPRTRQTAEIVNRDHGVPIVAIPDLRDIRSGFDGRPVAEYQAAIAADPLHITPPGGESVLAHKQRVVRFLDWLVRQPYRAVLVVGHEETARVLAAYFGGLSDRQMLAVNMPNGALRQFETSP